MTQSMSDSEPVLHLLTDKPSLRLRLLREEEAADLFALVDRNRTHLRAWLPWLDANTAVEHSLAFIQATRRDCAERGVFTCGLFFEGRLVGVAGIHGRDASNRSCQIGYWLDHACTGRGLMTSAVRAILAHLFTTLKFNRVEIRAATGNHASQAVCARLGFIREGVLRDAEWLYDHYVDLTVNSLLLREWQAAQDDDA